MYIERERYANIPLSVYIYIYVYIYINMCIYIYIYIYIYITPESLHNESCVDFLVVVIHVFVRGAGFSNTNSHRLRLSNLGLQ